LNFYLWRTENSNSLIRSTILKTQKAARKLRAMMNLHGSKAAVASTQGGVAEGRASKWGTPRAGPTGASRVAEQFFR
jgi:hypothetical protein